MKISACLITLNEEANLPRCLESIRPVVDEIVIIDSGSTDRTNYIATEFNARFLRHEWEGYVGQKNFALTKATHPWILSIDADEALSPQLSEEIARLREAAAPSVSGFSMPRVVNYQNRWIRFGDWYPDVLVRLFQKEKARFDGAQVHERLEIDGEILPLRGELYHFSFRDEADYLKRSEHYSTLWAQDKATAGMRANGLSPWTHGTWRFLRSLLIKGGFRGGTLGVRLAFLQAREVFQKYHKLARLASSR
ncbi:MAG: glycosyltransferase family 2 protein [Candidatus Methylacidiphilales bacterium]